jgi:hypothetical protein
MSYASDLLISEKLTITSNVSISSEFKLDEYTPSQLAGISISYMIGEEKIYGSRKNVPVVTSDQEFFLRENEVIVEINFCKTAQRVRSLKFISNFGMQYGPYGEERGHIRRNYQNSCSLSVSNCLKTHVYMWMKSFCKLG